MQKSIFFLTYLNILFDLFCQRLRISNGSILLYKKIRHTPLVNLLERQTKSKKLLQNQFGSLVYSEGKINLTECEYVLQQSNITSIL
ncbi:hypothetical protein pb186bvf_002032 [Paramecium bursaria]